MGQVNGQVSLVNPVINGVACTATGTVLNQAGLHAPYDRLSGKLGVATGFDTDPTNLAYCTDGDWTSVTGTGVDDAITAYAEGAYITWDMGATYHVAVFGKILLGTTTATAAYSPAIIIKGSINGSDYFSNKADGAYDNVAYLNNSSDILHIHGTVYGRYIRLILKESGGVERVGQLAVYEIVALDLGF